MNEMLEEEEEESAESELVSLSDETLPDPPGFEPLLEHLRRDRGFDFHGYKRATLIRRIERRMQTLVIGGMHDYLGHLESNPDEFPQLFNTILINVTAFFRDVEAWGFLSTEALPRIVATKSSGSTRRYGA
jgi:two-component system, chemotaxis family, CheB/CheR fusion protein